MSLIISCLNNKFALQASDRRLSSKGKAVSVEYNKAIVLMTKDARILIGMVGLAEYVAGGSVITVRRRIIELIGEASEPDREIENTLDRLRHALSKEFRKIRGVSAADRRVSLLFTGFQYDTKGNSYPRIWLLSNCETLDGDEKPEADAIFTLDSRFDSDIGHPGENFASVCVVGISNFIEEDDLTVLRDMAVMNDDPNVVTKRAVELIRKTSHGAPNLVGWNISTAVIPANGGVTASYHSDNHETSSYMPSLIQLLVDKPYWDKSH